MTTSTKATVAPARRYPFEEAFFDQAIRAAQMESMFFPKTLDERQNVRLKPKFNTACWAFLPPHNTFIGTELFEKSMVKLGLSSALQEKYIANHFHHENGHAHYTIRDMNRLKGELKAIDAPFQLYNLFEDAFMEEAYRQEMGYQFEWLTMETMALSKRPESLLFALIQSEGKPAPVLECVNSWVPEDTGTKATAKAIGLARESLNELFATVLVYYRKICAVKESLQLMPLLKKWLDEFGRPPVQKPDEGDGSGSGKGKPGSPGEGSGPAKGAPNPGEAGGMADLEHSAKLMTDPEYRKAFEKDAVRIGIAHTTADDDIPETAERPDDEAVADDNFSPFSAQGKVLTDKSTPTDMPRAAVLAKKLSKLFQDKVRKVSTMEPQKRISMRHVMSGRVPYQRKDIQSKRRRKVFFVMDCSASMAQGNQFPLREGKVLITALSLLARRGFVSGYIALSAVNEGKSMWEVFKLPLAQEVIDRIQAYAGAEGLEGTLSSNMDLVKDSDYVLVYTDADICDKPIDKENLHLHGVQTWGLYAGSDIRAQRRLLKYFDKAVQRDDAEGLVDAILTLAK
jgi:hypothetical protein